MHTYLATAYGRFRIPRGKRRYCYLVLILRRDELPSGAIVESHADWWGWASTLELARQYRRRAQRAHLTDRAIVVGLDGKEVLDAPGN